MLTLITLVKINKEEEVKIEFFFFETKEIGNKQNFEKIWNDQTDEEIDNFVKIRKKNSFSNIIKTVKSYSLQKTLEILKSFRSKIAKCLKRAACFVSLSQKMPSFFWKLHIFSNKQFQMLHTEQCQRCGLVRNFCAMNRSCIISKLSSEHVECIFIG